MLAANGFPTAAAAAAAAVSKRSSAGIYATRTPRRSTDSEAMASDGPVSDPADVIGSSDAGSDSVPPWRNKLLRPLATPVAKPVAKSGPMAIPGDATHSVMYRGQGTESTKARRARKKHGKLIDLSGLTAHKEAVKRAERKERANERDGLAGVGGASGSGGPMPPPPPPPAKWVPRPLPPPPPPPPVATHRSDGTALGHTTIVAPVAAKRGPKQPVHPPPCHLSNAVSFSEQQVHVLAQVISATLHSHSADGSLP